MPDLSAVVDARGEEPPASVVHGTGEGSRELACSASAARFLSFSSGVNGKSIVGDQFTPLPTGDGDVTADGDDLGDLSDMGVLEKESENACALWSPSTLMLNGASGERVDACRIE